jgi:hypothetical protein
LKNIPIIQTNKLLKSIKAKKPSADEKIVEENQVPISPGFYPKAV